MRNCLSMTSAKMFTNCDVPFKSFDLGDAAVVAMELKRKCILIANREKERIQGMVQHLTQPE